MPSSLATSLSPIRGGPTSLSTITPPDSSEGGAPPEKMSDSELLPLGSSVSRFIVVKHLSTGGQGHVYAAYDPDLERNVALKLLRRDVGGTADERRTRALKEAQEHAKLRHSNVVGILQVGVFHDQLFLALDYMERGTLKAWLAEKPRKVEEVLQRFVEAGRGLAAAHAQRLVHRDFKPENVLLDDKEVAHVSDFGLAQRGEAAGGSGTRRYLSPEQESRTAPVGPASDQFSFCVALCEALTGQVPQADKLPQGAVLPAWIRPVLLRGLAQKPADRYPSMSALLEALEAGPLARRRLISRVSLVLLITIAAAAVGTLTIRESATERARRECLDGVRSVEGEVWGRERVALMEQRFASAGGVAGVDTFVRVKQLMAPQVEAWSAASALACERPVSLAHERCLLSRRRALQSLSGLFLGADRDVVAGALNAVRLEVLPVAGCLTTSVSSPRVVPDSEADQRLRPELARARVLRAAGLYREAVAAALAVGEQARAGGAVRVEAESKLLAGQVYSQLKDPQTEPTLKSAVLLAEQASADEERARAWMSLISWYGGHDDLDAAMLASDQVDSILERLGRPDHLEAQYQNQRGQLLKLQGDHPEAAKAFKRSYDIWRRHYDESDPLVLLALTNYALTLPGDEARPLLQRVLDTRIETFGAQHPETATAAYNLGVVLTEVEPKDAVAALERSLQIWQGQNPPDPCRLAQTHFAISRAWDAQQDMKQTRGHQRVGLELVLGAECTNVDLKAELEYLLLVEQLLEKPETALQPLRALLALLQRKETLPKNLPP